MSCSYLAGVSGELNDINRIVITPYRTTKHLGNSTEINGVVHELIHEGACSSGFSHSSFECGDRVIIIQTNYDAGYFNGEPGEILRKLPDGKYVVNLYDRTVTVQDVKDMTLGYAITVHKSQGSEYDVCDICIPEYSEFITRRMLYTAITRAKTRIRLWTDKETLRRIILNNPDTDRKTFMKEA